MAPKLLSEVVVEVVSKSLAAAGLVAATTGVTVVAASLAGLVSELLSVVELELAESTLGLRVDGGPSIGTGVDEDTSEGWLSATTASEEDVCSEVGEASGRLVLVMKFWSAGSCGGSESLMALGVGWLAACSASGRVLLGSSSGIMFASVGGATEPLARSGPPVAASMVV